MMLQISKLNLNHSFNSFCVAILRRVQIKRCRNLASEKKALPLKGEKITIYFPLILIKKMAKSVAYSNYRELKQTTTATATRTSPNKRFNEQNYSCARAL